MTQQNLPAPDWYKKPPINGFYLLANPAMPMSEATVFYGVRGAGVGMEYGQTGWLYGPIPGYPTENQGIIDA